MKKRTRYLIIFACFSIITYASAQKSFIGVKAPDLLFKKMLNDKDSIAKISDFAGKAVIIDFWATWCGSCLEGFLMLDSLQKMFPKDLKVVAITSENESRVNKFLAKFKTSLPIALDTTDEFAKFFPHRSIPHSILIDKNGIIKAVTTSSNINKEIIQKLMNGESLGLEEKMDKMDFDIHKNSLSGTPNVLNQITLMPYSNGLITMSTRFQNNRMDFINLLPSTIYEILFDYPLNSRSYWEADESKNKWANENLYCLEIIASNKTEKEAKETLIDYLKANIWLKARIDERETKVKVLRKIGKEVSFNHVENSDKSEVNSERFSFEMKNSTIKILVNALEERLELPVFDETNLIKKYNIKINWENKNQLNESLMKLGLELIEENRKIKMIVFYE